MQALCQLRIVTASTHSNNAWHIAFRINAVVCNVFFNRPVELYFLFWPINENGGEKPLEIISPPHN